MHWMTTQKTKPKPIRTRASLLKQGFYPLAMCIAVAAAPTLRAQSGPASPTTAGAHVHGIAPETGNRPFTIVLHGGSGTILRANITPKVEASFRAGLQRALDEGYRVLERGGSSLDAVVATVRVMEDDPQFNAGKGAVFTNAGRNELDASVMDGATGMAGAVAGVTTAKNPISAALAVMQKTRHVLLTGDGADAFAKAQGLEIVDPAYFRTQHRWDQLQRAKETMRIELDHDGKKKTSTLTLTPNDQRAESFGIVDDKFGTVGAVAIDKQGNLAAATSTGGLTNKLYGRVGDSPIIGAGTFADRTVAVSGTGTGEFFMRSAIAYDISARMRYEKRTVDEAVKSTITNALVERKGRGGVIAVDANAHVSFGFNTDGMYRGYRREGAAAVVQIFRD